MSSSNDFISFTSLQNQWSKNGNEPAYPPIDHEKTKPDLKLEFQFEKVKKLEGELATEQQRLKVINLTAEQRTQRSLTMNDIIILNIIN